MKMDKKSYHHNNLKNELIEKGIELVSNYGLSPVSYTHLDVYKRQGYGRLDFHCRHNAQLSCDADKEQPEFLSQAQF